MIDELLEDIDLDEIRGRDDLTVNEKKRSMHQRISQLRVKRESTSSQTIATLMNCLIGSGCMVFPMLFLNSGMLFAIILIFIMGFIGFKTCRLLVIHVTDDEENLQEVVEKLLGSKFRVAFSISSSLILFFVTMIYFLILNNMFYSIFLFIFNKVNFTNYSQPTDIAFDKFSFQYTTLMTIPFLFASLFVKKLLKYLIKFGPVGTLSLFVFSVFLIYNTIQGGIDSRISDNIGDLATFKSDTEAIISAAGTFALSFTIHNSVIPIMKNNIHQDKNTRDLGLAYSFTGVYYMIIGIFGAFAIVGRKVDRPSTVMDYFTKDDIFAFILHIMLFIYMFVITPLVSTLSKTQFLQIFYQTEKVPFKINLLFNVIFSSIVLLVGLLNLSPTLIMAFAGSIGGFLLMYIIPIFIHVRCIYVGKKLDLGDDAKYLHENLLQLNKNENSTVAMSKALNLCNHDRAISHNLTKSTRYVFYGILIAFGIAMVGIQLYNIIHKYT